MKNPLRPAGTIIIIAIVLTVVLGLAWWGTSPPKSPEKVDNLTVHSIAPPLPSPAYFQQQINKVLREMGKDLIKVDGRFGAESREAWEKAYIYQMGNKHCSLDAEGNMK